MSKLKRYVVLKTEVKWFESWAENEDDALDMVKNKRYLTVGSENERGYSSFFITPALVSWQAVLKSSPTKKEVESNE